KFRDDMGRARAVARRVRCPAEQMAARNYARKSGTISANPNQFQFQLAPLRGANQLCEGVRGVSLRSTPGYSFPTLRVGPCRKPRIARQLFFAAPSWRDAAGRRLRDSRVLVTLVEAGW